MDINLLDIVSIEDLQELQDTLAQVAGVGAVIVDLEGKHLTKASGYSRFCALMRATASTEPNCKMSARELGALARLEKRPAQKPCRNLGLSDASAPIILNDVHVANWMIGQCVTEYKQENEVRAFARENGIDEDQLFDIYKELQVSTPEAFSNAVKLLSIFTQNLSQLCYKNYLLQEADKEKERVISTLNSVLSNIEAAIYVCDPTTHELVFVNDFLSGMVNDHNLVGKNCLHALGGLSRSCAKDNSHLYKHDGTPLTEPYRWEFSDPTTGVDYIVQDMLMHWHDGRLLKLSMYIDITERKALLAAEASNTAKRDFLAQMSHELRTPMNGVLGMTQLALQADPPANQRHYLQKIQTSATLLLGVINDVLEFSKIEAGKLELSAQVFNLREVISTVNDMLLPRVQAKNLALQMMVNPEIPDYLYGDSLRLSQVLMNLLGNSVKFTQEGYIRLTIEAAKTDDNDSITLLCSISDTGIGMTPEQVARLFSPFMQADSSISRQFGGTGLGLTISKKLVELMGGNITVTSEAGKGSTFSFNIILGHASASGVNAASSHGENAAETDDAVRAALVGKRLLLAEDNEINQEIALEILRSLGGDVELAENGKQAVAAFAEKNYDLILMDLQMPLMDGYEATRRIRSSDRPSAKTIPIVAMTANAMKEDREKSHECGMTGHISKPIDINELKKTLISHLS